MSMALQGKVERCLGIPMWPFPCNSAWSRTQERDSNWKIFSLMSRTSGKANNNGTNSSVLFYRISTCLQFSFNFLRMTSRDRHLWEQKIIWIENLSLSFGWFLKIYNLNVWNGKAICIYTCEIHHLLNCNAFWVFVSKKSNSSLKVYTLSKSRLFVDHYFYLLVTLLLLIYLASPPQTSWPSHLNNFCPFLLVSLCSVFDLTTAFIFKKFLKWTSFFLTLLVCPLPLTCFTHYFAKSWIFLFIRLHFSRVLCT